MTTMWRRWQDYATMLFGVLLFVSPFVFGETSQQTAAVSAYVLGVLLFFAHATVASRSEATCASGTFATTFRISGTSVRLVVSPTRA